MPRLMFLHLLLAALLGVSGSALANPRAHAPYEPAPLAGLKYGGPFFPGAEYDPGVPAPERVLGYPLGQQAAAPAEIVAAFEAWAAASARATVVEYARSYEGRPLIYVVITSPENHARIDAIKQGLAAIADPRNSSDQERRKLLESIPGVAWLSHSIHGNETSGADAALATGYHLIADQREETRQLLNELVVLIDPNMNPDGRARFYQQTAEYRGMSPNVDDQSLVHSGYWPWGRMSHYLFDLNRDWIFGTHPETRGRIRAASEWHPLLFVDAHEMGAQDTYLFSPAREPHNPHFPDNRNKWAKVFSQEQAAAFDRYNWPYYTGEWNEGWYPGYSDAWASFRGALGILYEQARVADDGVRQGNGQILSYRESVHHQAVSALANLRSLQKHYKTMLREFHADRVKLVSSNSPYADRVYAITPTDNGGRLQAFMNLMDLQGFEVYRTKQAVSVRNGVDQLGRKRNVELPAGTLLVPNRQPEARLLAAMLDFDPRISPAALEYERNELVRRGASTIYDTTAWNITMMFGLQAFQVEMKVPGDAERASRGLEPAKATIPEKAIAYAINGIDDRAVAAAGRLLERGIQVRVTDKKTALNGHELPRGSVVVNRYDNRAVQQLEESIGNVAAELGVAVISIGQGLGEGDLPDIGGEHFRLLEAPRIAVLARGSVSPYDFGAIWYVLDHRLGLRHSHIHESSLTTADLRRYNVLVLPDRWGNGLQEPALKAIKAWVENGGTLIASGGAAAALATEEAGVSQARLLPNVLDKIQPYRIAIHREWLARQQVMPDMDSIWSHTAAEAVAPPWLPDGKEEPRALDKEELERRDNWLKLFMPQGALLAARVDEKHWLTFGASESLPVLYGRQGILMAADSVEAPLRMGVFNATDDSSSGLSLLSELGKDKSGDKQLRRVGWAPLPEGQELRLRMSGLLWPEAGLRVANSAYVTREKLGRGQVILFAAPPIIRGATLGTSRILENALVFGPGLGAQAPIRP